MTDMPAALQSVAIERTARLTARDDQSAARRRWVFAVIAVGAFMAQLDLFIVNIAFPAIHESFPGSSTASLSWVLNAYAIVFAACLVPAGRLADLLGRRRTFQLGLVVFAIASAACAAAPTLGILVAARAGQAVGAALLIPTSLGLLLHAYPPARRVGAVGAWVAVGAVAAAGGPGLGGLLVEISWKLIFLVNIPLAIGALVGSMAPTGRGAPSRGRRPSRPSRHRPADRRHRRRRPRHRGRPAVGLDERGCTRHAGDCWPPWQRSCGAVGTIELPSSS